MKFKIASALLIVYMLILPGLAFADANTSLGLSCPDLTVTGISDKEKFISMVNDLKAAALAKDEGRLRDSVLYPLQVNGKPKRETIADDAALKAKFASVFTARVMKALASADAAQVFCRDQGAMLGDGEVWLRQVRQTIGIAVINPN